MKLRQGPRPRIAPLLAVTLALAPAGLGAQTPAATAAVTSPPSPGDERSRRRGPTEIRDQHLLAQPRLTLPAFAPDTLGRGVTRVRATLHWSNSFGWNQDEPGESPGQRRFLVDGETATLALEATRGLSADVDLSLRLPVWWRGGGAMDGMIEAWHRLLGLSGRAGGARERFRRNVFRAEGVTAGGRSFSWNDAAGTGLGDVELSARWRWREGGRDGWTAALAGRLSLPSGTGPFDGGGFGLGLQGAAAKSLSSSVDIQLGAGATAASERVLRGLLYERYRAHGFLALEWRPGRPLSLIVQTDVASRLVRDVQSYPGLHWVIHASARIDVSSRTRLDLGFTENIKSQPGTTDFGVHVGLGWRR